MNKDDAKFIECDTCKANPKQPFLCAGCVHNRSAIGYLKYQKVTKKPSERIQEIYNNEWHKNDTEMTHMVDKSPSIWEWSIMKYLDEQAR